MSKRIERLLVPDALARAAVAHQRCLRQLDLLRRQRLSVCPATMTTRATPGSRRGAAALVLFHESRIARDTLREEVGHLVAYLAGTGAPLRRIVEHVRGMIDALQTSGVLADDDGVMADEIAHWILDDARARRSSVARTSRTHDSARVLPLRKPANHHARGGGLIARPRT